MKHLSRRGFATITILCSLLILTSFSALSEQSVIDMTLGDAIFSFIGRDEITMEVKRGENGRLLSLARVGDLESLTQLVSPNSFELFEKLSQHSVKLDVQFDRGRIFFGARDPKNDLVLDLSTLHSGASLQAKILAILGDKEGNPQVNKETKNKEPLQSEKAELPELENPKKPETAKPKSSPAPA
ncbi:hypothetical protein KGY79_13385, partial [Candidatus Bipolaricaulota bacterium]|nr:hypothetical protein [Candidatus Bipolaricaulota bacterium]